MVRRSTRPLTESDRRTIVRATAQVPERWWERLIAALARLVVVAFGAGMAGACWLGATGMSGWVKVLTLVGAAGFAGLALSQFWKAVRRAMPVRAPERGPEDLAGDVACWGLSVLRAWDVQTGDDDVPTFLVEHEPGRFFVIHGQKLWDLVPAGTNSDGSEHVGTTIEWEEFGGLVVRCEHRGGPVRIETLRIEDAPEVSGRETPWWFRDAVEVSPASLPRGVLRPGTSDSP